MAKILNQQQFVVWLRAEIDRSGKSDNEWAVERGIQQATMSRVLSGKRGVSARLAQACGWEMCYRPIVALPSED